MSKENVEVQVCLNSTASLPVYSSKGAAGADVRAHIQHEVVVQPGEVVAVPTGISLSLPEGYEIQVRPRSGLAVKHGITVLNAPGTIDSDYRGEINVILINHGKEPFTITPDMRIAQLVLAPVVKAIFVEAALLSDTIRGCRGFGHTGLN